MSSTAIPLPTNISIGLRLVPIYTGRVGNAIVTDRDENFITVVTDFGNEIVYTENEVRGLFEATESQREYEKMYKEVMEEDIDPIRELLERFETQKELIEVQLKKVKMRL